MTVFAHHIVRIQLHTHTPQVFTHFTNSTNAQQNFHKRFSGGVVAAVVISYAYIRTRFHIRFMKPTKAERRQAKRRRNQIKFHKVMRKKIDEHYICIRF